MRQTPAELIVLAPKPSLGSLHFRALFFRSASSHTGRVLRPVMARTKRMLGSGVAAQNALQLSFLSSLTSLHRTGGREVTSELAGSDLNEGQCW
jgi:hypothetical protein